MGNVKVICKEQAIRGLSRAKQSLSAKGHLTLSFDPIFFNFLDQSIIQSSHLKLSKVMS